MLGDPDLSVGSPNDIAPDWRLFECTECGEVEEIDMAGSTEAAPNSICTCGAVMQCIDEE